MGFSSAKGKFVPFYRSALVLNVVTRAHPAMKWSNAACEHCRQLDVKDGCGALYPKSDAASFQPSADRAALICFLHIKHEIPYSAPSRSKKIIYSSPIYPLPLLFLCCVLIVSPSKQHPFVISSLTNYHIQYIAGAIYCIQIII